MDQLFNIFKVNREDAIRIASDPVKPHDHEFEELIIGMEGELEHFIDFKSGNFVAPFVSFVTKGKLHRLIPLLKEDKFEIWVIGFRSEFIPETTFQLYANYHDHANLMLQRGRKFDRMVSLCGMMYDESLQETPDYAVIRLLLSTMFTMIESERKLLAGDEGQHLDTRNVTFRNFLVILEENFRRAEGVDFYAQKLFMSARNLNLICHSILQKSVSEIIETRKLIEAKNLLISTDKTVSEIGFELGYNEKAYFTNVFKKRSGQTPTEFREEMKKLFS